MPEIYHKTARADVEEAVKRAPHEWSLSLRGFAPWPPAQVRGDPVIPPSLADTWPCSRIVDEATK
jgi:hypothetical protein